MLLLHPGWVCARMGGSGSSPSISPEGRVPGMLSLADRYELNLSGGFFRLDGVRMPE